MPKSKFNLLKNDGSESAIEQLFSHSDAPREILESVIDEGKILNGKAKIYGMLHPNISFRYKTEKIFIKMNGREISGMLNTLSQNPQITIPDDVAKFMFQNIYIDEQERAKLFSVLSEDNELIKIFKEDPDEIKNIFYENHDPSNPFVKVLYIDSENLINTLSSHIVNNNKLLEETRIKSFQDCDILLVKNPPRALIPDIFQYTLTAIEDNKIDFKNSAEIKVILCNLVNKDFFTKEMYDEVLAAIRKEKSGYLNDLIPKFEERRDLLYKLEKRAQEKEMLSSNRKNFKNNIFTHEER